MWRIGWQDIEDYIAGAYRRTAERIAAGEVTNEGGAGQEWLRPGLAVGSEPLQNESVACRSGGEP